MQQHGAKLIAANSPLLFILHSSPLFSSAVSITNETYWRLVWRVFMSTQILTRWKRGSTIWVNTFSNSLKTNKRQIRFNFIAIAQKTSTENWRIVSNFKQPWYESDKKPFFRNFLYLNSYSRSFRARLGVNM